MSQAGARWPGSERTVAGPPSAGRRHSASDDTRFGSTAPTTPADSAVFVYPGTSHNAVLAAASPLLAIAAQIRRSASHPDPYRLKDDLTRGIRHFEQHAANAGVPHANIVAARYVLCTFLDECAAGTPWGGGGIWASDTLLVRLHNEAWGGEKVFQLLSRLAQEPRKYVDLLELIYVCLSLGFEGRYRIAEHGRSQLESVRERLYQILLKERGPADLSLSAAWQPARTEAHRWFDMTPLWVFLALCLAMTLATFVTYRTVLNSRSDPVFSILQGIRPPPSAKAFPPPPTLLPPTAEPRLAQFLAPEIAAGHVSVQEAVDRSIITLRSDSLFEPGSAQVNSAVLPLLDRIAAALRDNPGTVIVDGHTDSRPIRSVRFPSNFHLSQERANGVGRILGAAIGPDRIRTVGKAESEPIASNDTPAGRAQNRRVTITLLSNERRPP